MCCDVDISIMVFIAEDISKHGGLRVVQVLVFQ